MVLDARFSSRRLRWRLVGAWQWPAFFALTAIDALILRALPPFGGGLGVPGALIVAGFANLLLLGACAPWLARRLADRARRAPAARGGSTRPTAVAAPPPLEVVQDRTAIALLCAGALGLVAAGLAARPLVVSETEETRAQRRARCATTRWPTGSPEVVRNLDSANTYRLGDGHFRTCVALDDRTRAWCVFVETRPEPPTVRPDPNPAPNAAVFGDQPGG